jgi:hypothetical protein
MPGLHTQTVGCATGSENPDAAGVERVAAADGVGVDPERGLAAEVEQAATARTPATAAHLAARRAALRLMRSLHPMNMTDASASRARRTGDA